MISRNAAIFLIFFEVSYLLKLIFNFSNYKVFCNPNKLKSAILDESACFPEQNGEEMVSRPKYKAERSPKNKLRLADLIVDKNESNPLKTPKLDEIVTICPRMRQKDLSSRY